MTKQQEVLRTVGWFLKLQSMGYQSTAIESKIMADMCFISLPMKYRLSKEDLAKIEVQAQMRADLKAVKEGRV